MEKKLLQHNDPTRFKGSLHEALTKDLAIAIQLLKALFGHWVTTAQIKQLPTPAYYKTPNNMKTYYSTWMKKLNDKKQSPIERLCLLNDNPVGAMMIVITGAKDKQLITMISAPSVLPLMSPDSAMDEVIL